MPYTSEFALFGTCTSACWFMKKKEEEAFLHSEANGSFHGSQTRKSGDCNNYRVRGKNRATSLRWSDVLPKKHSTTSRLTGSPNEMFCFHCDGKVFMIVSLLKTSTRQRNHWTVRHPVLPWWDIFTSSLPNISSLALIKQQQFQSTWSHPIWKTDQFLQ